MNIQCRLGIHSYKRVSEAVPASEDDEFNFTAQGYALGKCKRCSRFSMVRCYGRLDSYYLSAVKTKSEWLRELVKDYNDE